MSENEKVLFSWRVLKGEDGSIRTESYTDPEWKESLPDFGFPGMRGRHHHHHREGMAPPFVMAERMRRRGRRKAREMLDWMESMYDEFYRDDDERGESAGAEA